jgi:hypothetical protein
LQKTWAAKPPDNVEGHSVADVSSLIQLGYSALGNVIHVRAKPRPSFMDAVIAENRGFQASERSSEESARG